MKTKREQVEEIAKERNKIKDIMKVLDKCVSLNPMYKAEVATVVYGNNYRKASEVIDEFAKRIKERTLHSCHKIINCYEVTRIETVVDDIADEMRQEVEK